MYQLVSAIAKKAGLNTRWEQVEIGSVKLYALYTTYQKLVMNLTNPFLDGPVSLDFDAVRAQQASSDLTVNEWLTANGNNTLPTTALVPELKTTYVKYADAIHAQYDIEPIPSLLAPDYQINPADERDLMLTRLALDISLFYKNCLVTVNGFFHLTDYMPQGIRVIEGGYSKYKSLRAACGLYSFRELGELTMIPIRPEMLYKLDDRVPYYEKMCVQLNTNLEGKTVLLVLGGYLHLFDRTYRQIGESSFQIDFANYPLLERIYESRPYIDLSSLGLQSIPENPEMIAVEDLQSDAVLQAYATLSQSFFVVVDSDDIYYDLIKAADTGLPGSYVSYVRPDLPLRTGFARMSEYWYTYEDGVWSISCEAVGIPNYNFETVDLWKQRNVDDTRYSFAPEYFSPGFFLKICKDY